MKKSCKTRFIALVVMLFIFVGASMGLAAEKQYSFNISLDASDDEIISVCARKLKDELEARSNGQITATVYTNGTLGSDSEALQSCADGAIAFVLSTTAPQVTMIPELAIFDLPNLYTEITEFRKLFDNNDFVTHLTNVYEKHGLHLLGIADSGFRVMTSNKKVTSLPDFNGTKIRTMQNSNHIAIWRAYGANPTPMAFGEVYIGLQQGTIDAQENPIEVAVAGKFYEQQKYMILTNHLPHAIVCLMSGEMYNDLPDDLKQVIDDASKIAIAYTREHSDKQNAEQMAFVKGEGTEIIELSPDVLAKMREAAMPLYDNIRKQSGDEMYNLLMQALDIKQ